MKVPSSSHGKKESLPAKFFIVIFNFFQDFFQDLFLFVFFACVFLSFSHYFEIGPWIE